MRASTSRARSPAGPLEGEASPCLGLCERAPAALVVEAGEAPTAAPVHDGEWDAAWSVPQRGQPGLVLLARAGVVDPSSLTSYEVARWLRRAAQGGRDRRGRRRRRSHAQRARRSWRRGVPDGPQVAGGCGARVDTALPRRQRRRERAGHVQGSCADRERSVLARRGHDRSRPSRPDASAGTSTCAASTRSPGSGWRRRSRPHEPPATWATTSSGAAFASTSRCARARARTSAVRRPRCSTRSRDTAVSREASRPSRSMSASSASRRSRTTSRRS